MSEGSYQSSRDPNGSVRRHSPSVTTTGTATSSSTLKRASPSYSNSSGEPSGSNPFRNGSRDNIPSFATCFEGFHKLDHIGEHNIAAMSPPQAWTVPPPSSMWSGGGSAPHGGGQHSSSRQQQSSYHSSSGAPPLGYHHSPSPNAQHQLQVPISSIFSPIHRTTPMRQPPPTSNASTPGRHGGGAVLPFVGAAADSPGRSLPPSRDTADAAHQGKQLPHSGEQNFSYRTLDLSEDDEAASDPIGTPPRTIERDEEEDLYEERNANDAEHQNHQIPSGFQRTPLRSDAAHPIGGLSTPDNRPPLHPAALSPILASSPEFGGDRAGEGRTTDQVKQLSPSSGFEMTSQGPRGTPPSSRKVPVVHSDQPPYVSPHRTSFGASSHPSPHRNINPTLLTPPRRPRSLEELAAKHLFPLFGAFLRSLPPKQLEHFLVYDDAIFDDCEQHWGDHVNAAKYSPSALERKKFQGYEVRSLSERVDAIVPPLDDLLDTPRDAFGASPYAIRDFAYRHPLYTDTAGTTIRFRTAHSRW